MNLKRIRLSCACERCVVKRSLNPGNFAADARYAYVNAYVVVPNTIRKNMKDDVYI